LDAQEHAPVRTPSPSGPALKQEHVEGKKRKRERVQSQRQMNKSLEQGLNLSGS